MKNNAYRTTSYVPAVDKHGPVSSPPLDLGHLLYHIHNSPQVRALAIWCPAGNVELGHLVSLLDLFVYYESL